jgi:hypothetical protein
MTLLKEKQSKSTDWRRRPLKSLFHRNSRYPHSVHLISLGVDGTVQTNLKVLQDPEKAYAQALAVFAWLYDTQDVGNGSVLANFRFRRAQDLLLCGLV